ncbi:hypothetical protein ACFYWU_34230 [Streptomyces chrestomyceticus]|uniref:hypothetical protein n=1 Tax=Streptomyces chrestomyceticus TaxID=68185 RepID=UPI0036D0CBB9
MDSANTARPRGSLWARLVDAFHGRDTAAPSPPAVPFGSLEWRVDPDTETWVILRLTQPQATQVWADRGYAGDLVDWARERLWLTLHIVSRPKGAKGFVVPRTRYERLPQHSEAHLNWSLITTMTRRLTRKSPRHDL